MSQLFYEPMAYKTWRNLELDTPFLSEQPTVTVVVLNWCAVDDTIACVESLQRQSYKNLKIVIVDNGSNDGSEEALKAHFPKNPVIQTGANLGFGGGVNVGIQHALDAGADFVWLLNNDAVVQSSALTLMVDEALKDPKIGLVGGKIVDFDDESRILALGGGVFDLRRGLAKHINTVDELPRLNYLTGASVLLRSDMLEAVGLFDSDNFFMYWEDADLCMRASGAGWKMVVADRVIVRHHESKSSGGGESPQFHYMYALSAMRFFYKHTGSHKVGWKGRERRFRRLLKSRQWRGAWSILRAVCRGLIKPAIKKA